MKKVLFLSTFVLCCILIGCGGDDGGTNGNGDETPPPRLVAVDTVSAPSMLDANDPVWNQIDSVEVEVGFYPSYGQNPQLYKDTLLMKVIKTADMIYIWANWRDGTADLYGRYSRKLEPPNIGGSWEHIYTADGGGGEDGFFIIFDAGDNGEEGADCALMCHAVQYRMATTGGGHVDAWCWKSATTNPGFLAEDQWWSSVGNIKDPNPQLNPQVLYATNWDPGTSAERPHIGDPDYMHPDDTAFHGIYLYEDVMVEYDNDPFIGWDSVAGYRMPGHFIDSTIYSSEERDDRWDVLAISHYDSLSTWHRWTVVLARTLTPSSSNDVDLSDVDSIQITIAVTNDHTFAYDDDWGVDAGFRDHSGSVPFYLILNESGEE